MNLASILLYPLLLLFPAAGGGDRGAQDRGKGDSRPVEAAAEPVSDRYVSVEERRSVDWADSHGAGPFAVFAFSHPEPENAWQVRIEQRMTIRIAPRVPIPADPDAEAVSPPRNAPRFTERKIGKCLPMNGISGVQPNGPRNLLLFMRDRRIISAELERACRAGAFYSGFLLSRSADGQLCVDRDSLLSRSGSSCKLTHIRQLVAVER